MLFLLSLVSLATTQYLPIPHAWTGLLVCQKGDFMYNMTDKVRVCMTCQRGCSECCDPSLCTSCSIGYRYNSTTSTCVRCPIFCDSCQLQGTTLSCLKCSPGYIRGKDGSCVQCQDGCYECENLKECKTCASGYYQNKQSCSLCPYGCATCDTTDQGKTFTCDTCITEYYHKLNACQHCPNGCKACDSKTHCTDCWDSFYMVSNICQKCTDNCEYCDSKNGKCFQCYLGYILDAKKNKCYGCPDILCLSCKLEHRTQCVQCTSGYDVDNGKCIECDTKCLDCVGVKNHCVKCIDTMYPDQENKCQSCLTNCRTCKKSDICEKCLTGYYLPETKKACTVCMDNCLACSGAKMCETCADGYFFNGIACTPCGLACQKCIGNGFCLKCTYGYYVSQGGCLPCTGDLCSCKSYTALVDIGYNSSPMLLIIAGIQMIVLGL